MMSGCISSPAVHMQGACQIKWEECPLALWDEYFQMIPRSNLLQSRHYGEAAARIYGQKIRHGLIYRDEHLAGMVQIQEAGVLKNAVHAIILDRGPLWFEGFGAEADFQAFLVAFNRDFPKRFGRRVRIIPEITQSDSARRALEDVGFKCKSRSSYQTIWLDLKQSLEDLRAGLKKNWRGDLRKAEKQGISVYWDDQGEYVPLFLKTYMADKARRRYDGPSPKLLKALAGTFLRGKNMLIGCAALDGKPIAGIVVFCHGLSATYQVGYASETGREKRANHILLWDALRVLKERNINDFDLGGVNDESARGVKTFKSGMGGELVETPGLYC